MHLNTYAGNGGAARAAASVNLALQRAGVDSHLITAHGYKFRAARTADRTLWKLQTSSVETWRSPARFSSITAREINRSSADVVNLHWVTDGFLSIEEIGKVKKPIVWTMYDMWPFTGTEHYSSDSLEARWKSGYAKDNRPTNEQGFDVDRWTFERKQRHWDIQQTPIHMVPASTWLERSTRSSSLMQGWLTTRVPHIVDTDTLSPVERQEARQRLRIPNAPTITFLASAGIHDRRKGWDLLARALPGVAKHHPQLQVMVVGPVPTPIEREEIERSTQTHLLWYGMATTSAELQLIYSAADVTAVPSREDNMPLTAMEAQACGCPVVSFDVGGLTDVIQSGDTGWLAEAEDSHGLELVLRRALEDESERRRVGASARAYAEGAWSESAVVPAYMRIYEQLTNSAAAF